MKLAPRAHKIFVEPQLISEVFAAELKSKTGLELSKPKLEGVPVIGRIAAIGSAVEADDLVVGDIVVFNQPRPAGVESNGKTFFSVFPEMIKAKVRLNAQS